MGSMRRAEMRAMELERSLSISPYDPIEGGDATQQHGPNLLSSPFNSDVGDPGAAEVSSNFKVRC